LLNFLNPVHPFIGVLTGGSVPFIVLTGLIAGLILKKYPLSEHKKVIPVFAVLGIIFIISGFILRHWFIISKIKATPSWGMICNGISFLLFIIIYFIADVKGKKAWATFIKPAGEHSLTTYLAPDILYHLIWMTNIPILIYKQSSSPWIVVGGSILWALAMAGLTALLVRINIKLKL
jgi:predicted acyltransferase